MSGLIGKKLGMTQVFDDKGRVIPVTVLEVGPCKVLALRTKAKDGYNALQLGYGQRKAKNVTKAVRGHVAAAGLADAPPAEIKEIRLQAPPTNQIGDTIRADVFAKNDFVDVVGTTKGRGFQGVVKRWRFKGGRASHGGGWTRRPGSIGMKTWPAKVYKQRRMPGRMGHVRRTVQNLKVVEVRVDENLVLIKGSVPGPNGVVLTIKKACKK